MVSTKEILREPGESPRAQIRSKNFIRTDEHIIFVSLLNTHSRPIQLEHLLFVTSVRWLRTSGIKQEYRKLIKIR